MEDVVKFGIGFVTGRPNVCKVINSTYERLINQFKNSDKKVEITIFILFDCLLSIVTLFFCFVNNFIKK